MIFSKIDSESKREIEIARIICKKTSISPVISIKTMALERVWVTAPTYAAPEIIAMTFA